MRCGHHHAERLHLVDRGVGGIAAAVAGAEQHRALDLPPQPRGERRVKHARAPARRPDVNRLSGRIAKAASSPTSISPIVPMNGSVQFPVRSMTSPNTSGDRMAARAEPVFINPLAVPAWAGAMSIGIAHIGPIVSSAKKNVAARQSAAVGVADEQDRDGAQQRPRHAERSPGCAAPRIRLPVRRSSQSLTKPPSASPATPPENTSEANSAEFFRFRW